MRHFFAEIELSNPRQPDLAPVKVKALVCAGQITDKALHLIAEVLPLNGVIAGEIAWCAARGGEPLNS